MFTKKTSLIIPTKDRPNQLIKLIKKLNLLNLKFKQIIIVDSSSLDKAYKIKNECIKKKLITIIPKHQQHIREILD